MTICGVVRTCTNFYVVRVFKIILFTDFLIALLELRSRRERHVARRNTATFQIPMLPETRGNFQSSSNLWRKKDYWIMTILHRVLVTVFWFLSGIRRATTVRKQLIFPSIVMDYIGSMPDGTILSLYHDTIKKGNKINSETTCF